MALTSTQQALFDAARESLPRWLFQDGDPQAIFGGDAVMFDRVQTEIDAFITQAYITTSTDVWLDQHAIDRNTRRQSAETDAQLRDRLRFFEDAVSLVAIQNVVASALTAAGLPTTYAITELKKDRGYIGKKNAYFEVVAPSLISDGETFAIEDESIADVTYEFNKTGGVGGGNVAVDISTAVTEEDVANAMKTAIDANSDVGTVTVINEKIVSIGTNQDNTVLLLDEFVSNSGFKAHNTSRNCFLSRGYRVGHSNKVIVMLPYGTPDAVATSILEKLRQKLAGGVSRAIEVKQTP